MNVETRYTDRNLPRLVRIVMGLRLAHDDDDAAAGALEAALQGRFYSLACPAISRKRRCTRSV